LDPHEKTRLLERNLTQFTCAACGHQAQVIYPILYHDMDQALLIWMIPTGPPAAPSAEPPKSPEEFPPEIAEKLRTRYRFRLVANLNELIEKILIFDAKLDDRIVELAKLVAVAKLPPDKTGGEVYFSGVTGTGPGATMDFAVLMPPPGSNFGFSLLRDPVCNTLAADFAKALKSQPAEAWPRVDEAFARNLLKRP
jgi:hypothetical protein